MKRLFYAVLCLGLAALLVSHWRSGTSTPDPQSTIRAEGTIDPRLVRCANYRAAYADMLPTKSERKLEGREQLLSSYASMRKFYEAFAKIFPEASRPALALKEIYVKAADGPLAASEESKMAGYEEKINRTIDKHCPNSGYPAG